MPRVLSFINYKGGVGKTTTAYHVGCSLAQHHGQRVLMIDADPQTNLTFLFREPDEWRAHRASAGTISTLYERYAKYLPLETERFVWAEALQLPTRYFPGLHLIPCDIDLLGQDVIEGRISSAFSGWSDFDRMVEQYLRERAFLKRIVESVQGSYDWILIDCPPNLHAMTQNALCASDYYVVTAVPDHLSTIGLNTLHQKVERIGKVVSRAEDWAKSKPDLRSPELGAIVFVKVRIGGERTTIQHSEHMKEIRDLYGDRALRTHTTEMIGYSEAAAEQRPVWELGSPNAKRAAEKEEYVDITKELVERLSGKGEPSS